MLSVTCRKRFAFRVSFFVFRVCCYCVLIVACWLLVVVVCVWCVVRLGDVCCLFFVVGCS